MIPMMTATKIIMLPMALGRMIIRSSLVVGESPVNNKFNGIQFITFELG
jgi:hypothetical protein